MNSDFGFIRLDGELGVLLAQGADTDAFLQGQFSNDLRKLQVGRAQLSSYSSAKGRMLAVLTLTRRDDGVEMELPRSLVEAFAKRLRMFVLRSKVKLVESTDGLLGLRGIGAAAALAKAGLPVPQEALECIPADGLRVMRRIGDLPRFTLHGPAERIGSLMASWPAEAALQAQAWTLDDVVAGVPAVLPATQDHFVAQMANLDQLGGISFDKGCYTGQEIVARLHYLGQLKRRMFLCTGTGAAPEPGSEVHDGDGGQAAGEVVLAAARPEGGFAASVVLQIAHAQSSQLRVGDAALSVPVPYPYR